MMIPAAGIVILGLVCGYAHSQMAPLLAKAAAEGTRAAASFPDPLALLFPLNEGESSSPSEFLLNPLRRRNSS